MRQKWWSGSRSWWPIAAIGLLVLALSIAGNVQPAIATGPDEEGGQFVFHGDVSEQRQAEIRTRYEAVADWFEATYGISSGSFDIHVGSDLDAVADTIRANGQEVPTSGAPCFWSGRVGYILVDGCEDPLPFERLYLSRSLSRLAQNPSALIEEGHLRAGPAWLFRGAQHYGTTAHRVTAAERLIEEQRADHLRQSAALNVVLEQLESSENFWADSGHKSIGWLAVDYLVQLAGPDAFVNYFRERGSRNRWEVAFEAAFGLPAENFYGQFPAHLNQLQQAQQEKADTVFLHRWWNAARESGRTQQIDVPAGGGYLAWYGIDAPLDWFFETYPSVGLVVQWSAARQRYLGAIREVPSTHSAILEIRRNSVIYVSTGANRSMPLEVPTPVHNRIQLEPGGDFVPWLGADGTAITEIAAAIAGSEVVLVRDSRSSETNDTDRNGGAHTADNGDVLWIVSPQSTRWIQTPIEPRPAVDAEGTIALLENPEAAEIADAEFKIIVAGGTVTTEDQAVVRARLADSIAFLRERYDTPMRLFDVQLYGDDHEERPGCGNAAPNHIVYRFWCRGWTVTGLTDAPANSETLTHEYFHYLQRYWNPRYQFGAEQFPIWLSEGAAFYSEAAYWAHRGLAPLEATFDERAERARGAPQPLFYFVDTGPWRVGDQSVPRRYQLAFLAVSRLVQISGNPDSWIEFWYPWNGRDRWDVFEETFGISIDDFYVEFEAWRAEHYPPYN